jgi:hypothetical protein
MVNITNKDVEEIKALEQLLKKIDASFIEEIMEGMDEIATRQPFLISFFLRYQPDYSMAALDEFARLILLIWKHLQFDQPGERQSLTEALFTNQHKQLLLLFKYAAGEPTHFETNEVLALALTQLQSKALLATVAAQFDERPALLQFSEAQKYMTIVDFYALILCMQGL